MKRILVVSAHPDDETLGVGGTLLKHRARGDELFWINAARPPDVQKKERRARESALIADFYAFKNWIQFDFTSTDLDNRGRELIEVFSPHFTEIGPQVVYLPNRSDAHSDHRFVFQAAFACCKSFRQASIERILMYETLSETEFAAALPENHFLPNVFVDISEHFPAKKEALLIYREELMAAGQPRSLEAIESLAVLRGSRIGCRYAEAFMLLFEKN